MEIFEKTNPVFNFFKGILISIIFTVVSLAIFATILVYTDIPESITGTVIIVVTGISILLGSSITTRKMKKNGLLNGAIIGAGYILLIYLISSILNSNFSLNMLSIIMIAVRNFTEEFLEE